jgi:gluconate 2-dehydrogenase alpha chain
MSADIVGNASLSKFDVLVIGSGAGGGAVANVLCKNGLDVLVLEAGPNHFQGLDNPSASAVTSTFANDELKLTRRNFVMPGVIAEPRTFRRDPSDGARKIVGDVNLLPKTVGGGTIHADMKMPRFGKDDFHLGSLLGEVKGASFADWPVDYDVLEPFYLYAERAMGVQGLAGSSPFEAPRSAPYPMPPGVPMYLGVLLSEGAKKLGYHPHPYPTAVNSRPYDGRPACVDCGFCGEHGCPTHAKGSSAVTTLRRALLSGHCQLRPETRVVRLLVSPTGKEITGVEALGPDGKKQLFQADRYVLAASPIEDARLLFLSDASGQGVGNKSGMVGRNVMFHYQTIAIGIFAQRVHGHRGRTVTTGMSDFRGKPGDPDHPLGGIVEFGGPELPINEALIYTSFPFKVGALMKSLIRQSPFRDHLVSLTMQAEDAPQLTNAVDLDPAVRDIDGLPVARVTYTSHPFETSARQFYAPKLLELLGASGAKYGLVAPPAAVPSSRHVLGTLRMGEDPAASVCDATGRFHDLGNLYAADGSLFPTSSGYNPTLTIAALASYVGASMVSPGSPLKAIE